MKAVVTAGDLSAVLQRTQRIVEHRTSIPILANALLDFGTGGIVVSTTNLDMRMTDIVKGEVAEHGKTTIQARLLADIARKFPTETQISLERKEETLVIKSGRARFTLQTVPAEDFPSEEPHEYPVRFTMKAKSLLAFLGQVEDAISTEETRYYLNGIYMHVGQTGNRQWMRGVATDGHRLEMIEIDRPEGADSAKFPNIILHRGAVEILGSVLAKQDADVTVELSAARARFEMGTLILVTKLIDGTYPDYMRVIPQNNSRMMTVERAEMMDALERAMTLGTSIKLTVEPAHLTIHGKNTEMGTATETLAVEYANDEISIGFNGRYLMDALRSLKGPKAQFHLEDAGSPALVRDPSYADITIVLMPMRVD